MPRSRSSTRKVSVPRQEGSAPVTPLPALPDLPLGLARWSDAKTVLVYGGSFDPPHYFHTVGPLVARKLFAPSETAIISVPAARNPLKTSGPHASDEHRLAMLRLSLDLPAPHVVWTDELDKAAWQRERGQANVPSYTVDTLRRLRVALDGAVRAESKGRVRRWKGVLRLLIGSDQVAIFHTWKDFRTVIELAEPLVLVREPVVRVDQVHAALNECWSREEKAAWCRRLAPNFPMDPASTDVRSAIARARGKFLRSGEAWSEATGKLEPLSSISTPVAEYIIKHKLYGIGTPSTKAPARAKKKARG